MMTVKLENKSERTYVTLHTGVKQNGKKSQESLNNKMWNKVCPTLHVIPVMTFFGKYMSESNVYSYDQVHIAKITCLVTI